MSITIATLAYKEEENLRMLLPKINEYAAELGEPYDLMVIDTAKPLDNTEQVCKENNARYINQERPGLGGAFATAVKYATGDKVLIMDSDGSHNPKHIPEMHKLFTDEKADVCIGSRYVKGGVNDDSKTSILMSKFLNSVFRICLGIKAKDISTNFRIYDAKQLKAIDIVLPNYDFLEEVLFKLQQNNPKLKIVESPIYFGKRYAGESKRRLLPFIIGYGRTLFWLTGLRIKGWFVKK
ncbi:MAG: glycosyltransferase [Abditibacteriota bacterium]|nr:glycosyltransferase [Abditibacteriota bacterium]